MAERPRATLVAGRSGMLERARGHAGRRQDEGARHRLPQETAATRRRADRTRSRARARAGRGGSCPASVRAHRLRRAVRAQRLWVTSVTNKPRSAMSANNWIAAVASCRSNVGYGSRPATQPPRPSACFLRSRPIGATCAGQSGCAAARHERQHIRWLPLPGRPRHQLGPGGQRRLALLREARPAGRGGGPGCTARARPGELCAPVRSWSARAATAGSRRPPGGSRRRTLVS